jgi:hypothetical protein
MSDHGGHEERDQSRHGQGALSASLGDVPAASGFTQREPRAGQPATEETEVRIVYTPSHLHVVIKALDSEPRKVVARGTLRAAPTGLDDSVAIIFATFNARCNGYLFATNANGVRTEVQISDEPILRLTYLFAA